MRTKKPWTTKAAMDQVYKESFWGGTNDAFYSGDGSHCPELVDPYVFAVAEFLNSFTPQISVCDLGCGDFNVGNNLVKHTRKYVAVDIVDDLINRNKELFKTENLKFQCLDIATDDLPIADCAILRQVLQHLSNAEIHQILSKLDAFKYVIITEHIPDGAFIPNKDIISGQGIRMKKKSGVDVLASPFHFQAKEVKPLVSAALNDGKGIIDTKLYVLF